MGKELLFYDYIQKFLDINPEYLKPEEELKQFELHGVVDVIFKINREGFKRAYDEYKNKEKPPIMNLNDDSRDEINEEYGKFLEEIGVDFSGDNEEVILTDEQSDKFEKYIKEKEMNSSTILVEREELRVINSVEETKPHPMLFDLKKLKRLFKTKKVKEAIDNINSSPRLYSESFIRSLDDFENYEMRQVYNNGGIGYNVPVLSFLKNGLFGLYHLNFLNVNILLNDFENEKLVTLFKNTFNIQSILGEDYYYSNNLFLSVKEKSYNKGFEYNVIRINLHISLINEFYIIKECLKECVVKQKEESYLYMLKPGQTSIDLNRFTLDQKIISIKDDYNDDFKDIDEVVKSIDTNSKGLTLFHGIPGCGKTSYINHLCHYFKDKRKVIYIPSSFLPLLNDAKFHELLSENHNALIVLEDAEEALISRDSGTNPLVQTLLNYTDGFLADIFKPVFLVTFNCDVSKIDTALLRKGRCLAKYEFKALEKNKAQLLSDRLGFDNVIEKEMSLADIYNQDKRSFGNKERNKVGFNFEKVA